MPPSHPPQNNPYAQAAGAYGANAQQHAENQREVEARALLKAAKFIEDMQKEWADVSRDTVEETLKYNRKIWLMFYDTAIENPEGDRPNDLRSNIINLANFIFKREVEILSEPDRAKQKEKLDILIEINREIAAGLMSEPAAEESEKEKAPAAPAEAPPRSPSGKTV